MLCPGAAAACGYGQRGSRDVTIVKDDKDSVRLKFIRLSDNQQNQQAYIGRIVY